MLVIRFTSTEILSWLQVVKNVFQTTFNTSATILQQRRRRREKSWVVSEAGWSPAPVIFCSLRGKSEVVEPTIPNNGALRCANRRFATCKRDIWNCTKKAFGIFRIATEDHNRRLSLLAYVYTCHLPTCSLKMFEFWTVIPDIILHVGTKTWKK